MLLLIVDETLQVSGRKEGNEGTGQREMHASVDPRAKCASRRVGTAGTCSAERQNNRSRKRQEKGGLTMCRLGLSEQMARDGERTGREEERKRGEEEEKQLKSSNLSKSSEQVGLGWLSGLRGRDSWELLLLLLRLLLHAITAAWLLLLAILCEHPLLLCIGAGVQMLLLELLSSEKLHTHTHTHTRAREENMSSQHRSMRSGAVGVGRVLLVSPLTCC